MFNYNDFIRNFIYKEFCRYNSKKIYKDKIDNLKVSVLNSYKYDLYLKTRLANYSMYCSSHFKDKTFNEKLRFYYDYYLPSDLSYDEIIACEKIYNSFRKRQGRLRKRIENMITNNNCLFLTLTFTDDVLNSTSFETRKKYVLRFLNNLNCAFVGNVDYGSENGREHYHCVVAIDNVSCNDWHYGAINFKRIINKNSLALAKYVAKLTNHALKESTNNARIIYSRKFK